MCTPARPRGVRSMPISMPIRARSCAGSCRRVRPRSWRGARRCRARRSPRMTTVPPGRPSMTGGCGNIVTAATRRSRPRSTRITKPSPRPSPGGTASTGPPRQGHRADRRRLALPPQRDRRPVFRWPVSLWPVFRWPVSRWCVSLWCGRCWWSSSAAGSLLGVDRRGWDEPGDVVDDFDLPAVAVDAVVVGGAEQDSVGQVCFLGVGPPSDVVCFGVAGWSWAVGDGASAVPFGEGESL